MSNDEHAASAEVVTTWANSSGHWHARVDFPAAGYGPGHLRANIDRIRAKARRAMRREIGQRQNVDRQWRCRVVVADSDLDHMNVMHSITYREAGSKGE
jgi:hypothetical protein